MAYFLDNVPPSQDTSIYPVGATYKQYVGESTPASLFGGTWTDITSTVAVGQDKIGYIYVQYPNQSDAATIFGGTWLNVSSLYAGLFFRAEGGSSLAFNAGNQLDAFQGHYHNIGSVSAIGANSTSGANLNFYIGLTQSTTYGVTNPITDGTNGTPRTASETRPVNTTIRVWSRSGYSITIWRRTSTATSSIASPTNIVTGIYDSGTNSKGSWIRYTDGTMQCWNRGVNCTMPVGLNQIFTDTYPQPFISFPSFTFLITPYSHWNFVPSGVNLPVLAYWNVVTVNTGISQLVDIQWTAIGKWK
jgi:hypothetical protein